MRNKISFFILAGAVAMNVATASAQDDKRSQDTRRNSWSIYMQGGASWATGIDYKSVDAATGTSVAPEFGVGVNYNILPWLRLGLGWEISKYKREQRLSAFEPVSAQYGGLVDGVNQLESSEGGIAYRNMWTRYNNIEFNVDFNLMEIAKRKDHRFNLYLGIGEGMMIANGNSYELGMGSEYWTDPNNTDANGNTVSDNWTSTGWVKTNNAHHSFHALYLPFNLSAEYDITPRFTIGVKGSYKYVCSGDEIYAPDGLLTAAVVLRYNFVGKKHGYATNKQKYDRTRIDYDALKSDFEALRKETAEGQAKLDENERELKRMRAENEALKKAVADCKNSKTLNSITVYFQLNSSEVNSSDEAKLRNFVRDLQQTDDATIVLVGEASADGSSEWNQRLSEARLQSVIRILYDSGISPHKIRSSKAIGDRNHEYSPLARKVEINVVKQDR